MAWLSTLRLRYRMERPLDAVKESHRINFAITVCSFADRKIRDRKTWAGQV